MSFDRKTAGYWVGITGGVVVSAFLLFGESFSIHPAYEAPPVTYTDPVSTKTVVVGELVTLDATGSSVVWFSEPKVATVTYGNENEHCVVAFRKPGTYLIFSAAIDDATKVQVQRVEVVVQSTDEPVVVDPVEPADPSLARLASLAGPDKAAVAASFRAVAAQVQTKLDAGVLVTPEQIVAMTTASNRRAVAGRERQWQPFFDELERFLSVEVPATMADHVRIWRQIASVLER